MERKMESGQIFQALELKTQGKYSNDKKVGIWLTISEGGNIIEQFDYDLNKKLPPKLSFQLHYPGKAREDGTEGRVIVSFLVNQDCSITDMKVIKSLSAECDKAALDAMLEYAIVFKRYNDETTCEAGIQKQIINFILH